MLPSPTGVVLLLCLALHAAAQYTTGRIDGVVLDATGAPVPSAKLSVRHLQTGAERTFMSGSAGTYTFPSLPPGPFNDSLTRCKPDSAPFYVFAVETLEGLKDDRG